MVLGRGLVGTSADTRAQGPICDNQAFQTSAPTWKGGHGKGQRFLFFWSPGIEWGQWTEVRSHLLAVWPSISDLLSGYLFAHLGLLWASTEVMQRACLEQCLAYRECSVNTCSYFPRHRDGQQESGTFTFAFLKHNCWSNSCSTSIAFSLSIQWSPIRSFSPNLFCKWLNTIIFLKIWFFFQWRIIALQNFEQPFIIFQDFVAWWVVVLPVFLASSCIFSQMAVRMVGRSQMARSVG